MKSSVALLSVSLASAIATPLNFPAQKCNVAPTALVKTNVQPYDVAEAATAEECQTICESDEACLSFVFGLAAHATTPSCLLYKVPAAQVPARSDGLHVFDKARSAKLVPTTAPTHAQPWGVAPKRVFVRSEQQCNVALTGAIDKKVKPYQTTAKAFTAEECQTLCESDDVCLSFLFGLPNNCRAPVCKLFKVSAAEIPIRSDKLFVFDKACPAKLVPVTAPTLRFASKDLKAKATEAESNQSKNTEVKDTKAKDTKNQSTVAYGKPAVTSTKCQTQAKQTANTNTNTNGASAAQKSN
ncbi:hypothetical protein ACHAPT_013553 [Fusarium lateritium]